MAGRVFDLDPEVKQLAGDSILDLVDQLGKPCRLYYDPIRVDCPDCVDGATNDEWRGGGRDTQSGECETCGGTKYLEVDQTETINMLVNTDPRRFAVKPPAGVLVPEGRVETKSYAKDAVKLLRSGFMQVTPANPSGLVWRYERTSEPVDVSNIAQGVTHVTYWDRSL